MKNKGKNLLAQFQSSNPSFRPPKGNFNKTFGMQGKITAMHSIQRASGRRGN